MMMDSVPKVIVGIASGLLLNGVSVAGDVQMAPGKERFAAEFLSVKLERVQLEDATAGDAIRYIFYTANSRSKDGFKGGYIVMALGKPVSVSLKNVSVREALVLITDRAELEWKFDGYRFSFWPKGEAEPSLEIL